MGFACAIFAIVCVVLYCRDELQGSKIFEFMAFGGELVQSHPNCEAPSVGAHPAYLGVGIWTLLFVSAPHALL